MSIEDYKIYTESLMSYWESKGMIDTARDEGRIEGEKKGRIEIVKKGIEMGMTDEEIFLLTGVEKPEIQKLRPNNL